MKHVKRSGFSNCQFRPAVLAVLLICLAPALQAADAAAPNPLVLAAREGVLGKPAPALQVTTIDGESIDLGASYGRKAIYLKFWATWCIPCRVQMPHFENVYQHAGDDLEVIAINAGFNDQLDRILEYREDHGIHMPIVIDDGSLAGVFKLRITPQHVVIGKDGIVKHIGNQADAELDAILERERHAPQVPLPELQSLLASVPHPDAGDPLPGLVLNTAEGRVALDAMAGTGTVLVFMIPWCESYLSGSRPGQSEVCQQVRAQVEDLRQQHPDLRWLGVSSGLWTVAGDLRSYASNYQVSLPLILDADGELFRAFGIMSVPTLIVADGHGRILRRIEGYDATLAETLVPLSENVVSTRRNGLRGEP